MENSKSSVCLSASRNGDHKLDNLPVLVYDCLFKYLPLDDLFNLKLVSKDFYSIVKGRNIQKLIFANDFNFSYGHLFKSKEFYILDYSRLSLLINPSENLLGLKYLRIENFLFAPIQLEDLNKFSKLQKLTIKEVRLKSDHLLQLPNLKKISIQVFVDDKKPGFLLIDAPNLRILKSSSRIDRVGFNRPFSIRHLKIGKYGHVSKFFNLESLELDIKRKDALGVITDLKGLKNLKKLKILSINSDLVQKSVRKLERLFRTKKSDLEIVLYGVKVKKINKFDEFKRNGILKFQLDNYGELEDLDFFKTIDYGTLEHLLPDCGTPIDLFQKYTNIQELVISRSTIKDENRFVNFIKNCKKLDSLDISPTLSQHFYDQLPEISSLISLFIRSTVSLNLEFIMKMPYLFSLAVDQDILFDENLNLSSLKYLGYLYFEINSEPIEISVEDKYVYIKDNTSVSFTYDEFVKWSYDLRTKKTLNE